MRRRGSRVMMVGIAVGLLVGAAAPTLASTTRDASTSGGWHWSAHKADAANGLACPSTKLCVGIDVNKVRWTTNPTAKKPKWTSVALEPLSQPTVATGSVILTALTCPTTHFCLTTDDIGNVFTTTNPTGGKAAWRGEDIDETQISAVSCASPSLCAGVDYNDDALVSTNAGAAAPRWTSTSLKPGAGADPLAVSCVGRSVCAAVLDSTAIYYTTTADATTVTWKHVKVAGHGWGGISCPTTSKCVAVGSEDFGAKVAVTTKLSGGQHTWKSATLKHDTYGSGLYDVDCASASDCFAVGNMFTTHLAAKAGDWHPTTVPGSGSETQVSCASTTWCFVADAVDDFYAGHH